MKFLTVVLVLLFSTSAFAADVDGKWSGSIAGPQGEFPVAFTFKADGATLTGSTTGFDGTEVPIKDGKVDGNNISWIVAFDFGGMPFELSYKGIVSADQIKVTGEAFGMPFEFLLKKTK